jgi:hypothetical protein
VGAQPWSADPTDSRDPEPKWMFPNQELRLSAWSINKPQVCRWGDQVLECADQLGIQLHSASDMRRALARNGFIGYGGERLVWAAEDVPRLQEFVRLTVIASAGMLY